MNTADQDGMRNMPELAPPIELEPAAGVQSFHMHEAARQVIEKLYKAYGIEATVDDSVRDSNVRLDVDDVDFAQASQVLNLVTGSFTTPIDAHRVVVAKDTRAMRAQYTHNAVETFSSGLLYRASRSGLLPKSVTALTVRGNAYTNSGQSQIASEFGSCAWRFGTSQK